MIRNLVGATISAVEGAKVGSGDVVITTDRGTLRLTSERAGGRDRIEVEDVTGDPADLVGGVVSVAEEREDQAKDRPDRHDLHDGHNWIFYEIRTTKGDLTLRWLGDAQGQYYSEEVGSSWTAVTS